MQWWTRRGRAVTAAVLVTGGTGTLGRLLDGHLRPLRDPAAAES